MHRERNEFRCYEDLYRLEYQFVYRYIKRIIKTDDYSAEDLTQEVFLVAFQKWESSVCGHPNIPGFLMRVAQNKLKKWFEQRSRIYVDDSEVVEFLEEQSARIGGMTEYERAEFYAALEKILSVEEANLLRYFYEYNYTTYEMAQIMNVSEPCFRGRMTRVRNKLKKYWGTMCLLLIGMIWWF